MKKKIAYKAIYSYQTNSMTVKAIRIYRFGGW